MNPTTDYWLTDDTQKARYSDPEIGKEVLFWTFPRDRCLITNRHAQQKTLPWCAFWVSSLSWGNTKTDKSPASDLRRPQRSNSQKTIVTKR